MTTPANSDVGRASRRKQLIVVGILCLAVAAVLAYNYRTYWSKRPPAAKGRTIYDFYTTWRCVACGYELEDRGAEGTRPCPKCQTGEMYVCIRFACPQHGVFPVYYLYDSESKHGDPTRIKVADGEWTAFLDEDYNINICCPHCGQALMPAERSRPAPPAEKPESP